MGPFRGVKDADASVLQDPFFALSSTLLQLRVFQLRKPAIELWLGSRYFETSRV